MSNTLYGIPNRCLLRAVLEELELMGMGDEQARKALRAHPLVDLIHAVNTIIQKPDNEHLECMNKWLLGEIIPSSKAMAREAMGDIKGVLNAAKAAKPHRGSRAGGVS